MRYYAYMPAWMSPKYHSCLRCLTDMMKRYSRPVVALGLLFSFAWAFPEQANLPLIVRNEIDRVTSGIRQSGHGGSAETSVDFSSCSNNPEEDMTTIDLIRRSGYPAEEHAVQTEDGYILALHRIPGTEGSPTVLLHHALLESSFCWVINGKGKGLAFILADQGYDVWMGNVRGNTYSRKHISLSTSSPEFWDFSWHEMGVYDLPAEIEYISSMKNDSLIYIGHSMGTTMFYVMASERPDIASKVKAMFGLAPVAFTDHIRGPFYFLGTTLRYIQRASDYQGRREFFAQNSYFKFAAKCICNRPILKYVCRSIVFSTVGYNFKEFNTTMLPIILTHTPAGTSLKTILHFAQGIQSKKFLQFDHGAKINRKIYNTDTPPEYDFSKIQVPIALFWGQNDFLAQPKDVRRLFDNLPKKVEMYKVEDPDFNHLDFLWGINAPELVYTRLISLMNKYKSSS